MQHAARVDLAAAIEELGGLATHATLVRLGSRSELQHALEAGSIVRTARGRYALPAVDAGKRAADAHRAPLCLASAALHHGWEVARVPALPQLLFPHNRKVGPSVRRRVEVHRGGTPSTATATPQIHTLEMCLRRLPFDEALAVADSALRHDDVLPATLRRIAASARGPGSVQVRRVARAARPDAANPFESVLRAVALDVDGLHVEPQVAIRGRRVWARPDLVDEDLGIVLEADSFEWHGGRRALDKDARRYNRLVVEGWIVLRFSWEQVMLDAAGVRDIMVDAVALAEERRKGRVRARFAA